MKMHVKTILVTKGIIMLFLFFAIIGFGQYVLAQSHSKVTVPQEKPTDKGVGPVTKVELGAINQAWVAEGKQLYNEKCIVCHNIDQRLIGPPSRGVIKQRTPEWIMNMILNPDGMVKEDPIAKKLLSEYNNVPMTNQNLTEDQARKLLEYFRTLE
jgi:mono/diheme cytochrome c family protein